MDDKFWLFWSQINNSEVKPEKKSIPKNVTTSSQLYACPFTVIKYLLNAQWSMSPVYEKKSNWLEYGVMKLCFA